MKSNILISRTGSNGDVLVASAIIPAIREKHPGHPIYFATGCPQTLMHNPHIDYLVSPEAMLEDFEIHYKLDNVYENKPNVNILQAYADVAEVDVKKCKMYMMCERVDMPLFTNYVVIHAGVTAWAGRNWIAERWSEVALKLHNTGYQIICVGDGHDRFVPCDVDVRKKTTVNQLATIIRDAKLFIGIDSLPFHIAQAVNTPGVVFFGSIKPETRIVNPNMTPVTAKNLACLGCHNRKPAPTFATNDCEAGTLICETDVSVDDMWEKISLSLS